MLINSSRRPISLFKSSPTAGEEEKSLLSKLPLDETTIEIPEALLAVSGLQDTAPLLGNSLRGGIGAMALLKSVQSFTHGEGLLNKIDGISALGLAVAAGGSIVGGPVGHTVGVAGESVHAISEIVLGGVELKRARQDQPSLLNKEYVSAGLGIAKGLTTFLPMVAPGTGTAVGILHLGILTTRAVLNK